MENILFWGIGVLVILTLIGYIVTAFEKRAERKNPATPAGNLTEVLGAITSATYSKRGFEANLAEYTPQQRADAPYYYWWWVLAANRTSSKRDEVILAVADALLPGGSDRETAGLGEYFWEVEYHGDGRRDAFIADHLVARRDAYDDAMKTRMIEGAIIIALLHDPDGDKYMVDKPAYGRGRSEMLADIRGLCLDWYGSKGEAVFADLSASAHEKAVPIGRHFGFSVAEPL